MNAALGRKWVAALRAGEYKQGHGRLYSKFRNEHCVLGVLCELSPLFAYWADMGVPVLHGDTNPIARSCAFIPYEIAAAVTLPSETCTELMRRNDKDGHTFAELADYIEQNLLDPEPQ